MDDFGTHGTMGFDLDSTVGTPARPMDETMTPPRRSLARQAIIADSGSPQVQLRGFNPVREELSARELLAMSPSASIVDARIRENQLLSDFYESKVLPKFAAMKNRLAERDSHIALLKEWCAETEKSMAFQETELKNLRTQLASVRGQLGEANQRIDSQTAVHLEISRQLESSQDRVHELEGELEAAQVQMQELQQGQASSKVSQSRLQELEKVHAAAQAAEARVLELERELEAAHKVRPVQPTLTGVRHDLLGAGKEPSTRDSRRLVAEIEAANRTMQSLKQQLERIGPDGSNASSQGSPPAAGRPIAHAPPSFASTPASSYMPAPETVTQQQQHAGSEPLSPGRSRTSAPHAPLQHNFAWEQPSYKVSQNQPPYQSAMHQEPPQYTPSQQQHQSFAQHQGLDHRLNDRSGHNFMSFAHYLAANPSHESTPITDRPQHTAPGMHYTPFSAPQTSARGYPTSHSGATHLSTFSEPSHTPHRSYAPTFSQQSEYGSPRQLPPAPPAPSQRSRESRFTQFLPVENQRLYQAPFPRSTDQHSSRQPGREFMVEC